MIKNRKNFDATQRTGCIFFSHINKCRCKELSKAEIAFEFSLARGCCALVEGGLYET